MCEAGEFAAGDVKSVDWRARDERCHISVLSDDRLENLV
jgi:hypothetical protein